MVLPVEVFCYYKKKGEETLDPVFLLWKSEDPAYLPPRIDSPENDIPFSGMEKDRRENLPGGTGLLLPGF
jgi:hypothetical protein